jgi:hypothetical protein
MSQQTKIKVVATTLTVAALTGLSMGLLHFQNCLQTIASAVWGS